MIHSRTLSKVCTAAVLIGGVQLAVIWSGPVAEAQTIQASGSDVSVIMGLISQRAPDTTDGKSSKNVQATQEAVASPWSVYSNVGYTSEYNFRGTNLTPDSDGAGFMTANVSRGGFTLGVYGIHQFGKATANSFSIGEGGGGGGTGLINVPGSDNGDMNLTFTGTVSPVTTQTRFNEIDVYLSYTHELGPLDITVGNIAFFIDRRAVTSVTTKGTFVDGAQGTDSDFHTFDANETVDIPTVGNETFDRFFIAVSAPRLFHSDFFNVVPKIYYYQTVYNDGSDPFENRRQLILAHDLGVPPFELEPHFLAIKGISERNSSLGGYLEGRLDANFKVGQRVTVQPYGLISASFHDRTEPYDNPQSFRQFIRSRSLVGFNNAQVGVKIPVELWRSRNASGPEAVLVFAPFGAYSYHISDPPAGTDRNEVWGGGQLELTF